MLLLNCRSQRAFPTPKRTELQRQPASLALPAPNHRPTTPSDQADPQPARSGWRHQVCVGYQSDRRFRVAAHCSREHVCGSMLRFEQRLGRRKSVVTARKRCVLSWEFNNLMLKPSACRHSSLDRVAVRHDVARHACGALDRTEAEAWR